MVAEVGVRSPVQIPGFKILETSRMVFTSRVREQGLDGSRM
jgi:hypothetical protein